MTLGICHTCKFVYRWKGPPLLRDAWCLDCRDKLYLTNREHAAYLTKVGIHDKTPAGGPRPADVLDAMPKVLPTAKAKAKPTPPQAKPADAGEVKAARGRLAAARAKFAKKPAQEVQPNLFGASP